MTVTFDTPTSFSARDEFDQVVSGGSDPLTALTAAVGGVWAGSGDADDFVVEDGGHTAQRTAVSDTFPGRIVRLPVSLTATAVQVDVKFSSAGASLYGGVVARYVDVNNFLTAVLFGSGRQVIVYGYVAAAQALHVEAAFPALTFGNWATVRLVVDAGGRAFVWAFPRGSAPGAPLIVTQHASLATGGALASGNPALRDYEGGTTVPNATRNYNDFFAFAPPPDAACFA